MSAIDRQGRTRLEFDILKGKQERKKSVKRNGRHYDTDPQRIRNEEATVRRSS